MPAILLFNDQFHDLFSIIGFETHEIHAVLQAANVDILKVFTDAQHTLAHDIEHLNLSESSTFDVEQIIGRVRIDSNFLDIFLNGIPKHSY